jgi:hypothetical protein
VSLDEVCEGGHTPRRPLFSIRHVDRAGDPHDAVDVLALVAAKCLGDCDLERFVSQGPSCVLQTPEGLIAAPGEEDDSWGRDELLDELKSVSVVHVDVQPQYSVDIVLLGLAVTDLGLETVHVEIQIRGALPLLDPGVQGHRFVTIKRASFDFAGFGEIATT